MDKTNATFEQMYFWPLLKWDMDNKILHVKKIRDVSKRKPLYFLVNSSSMPCEDIYVDFILGLPMIQRGVK